MLHTRPTGFGQDVRTALMEISVDPAEVLGVLGYNTAFRTGELVQMLANQPVEEVADSLTVGASVELDGTSIPLTLNVEGPLPWQHQAPSLVLSVTATSRDDLHELIQGFDPDRDAIFILMAYSSRETLDPDRYTAFSHIAIVDTASLDARGLDPIPLAIAAIVSRQAGVSIGTQS